jgi:SAM-dependent methyltransferase
MTSLASKYNTFFLLREVFVKIVNPTVHFIFKHTRLDFDHAHAVDTQTSVALESLDISGHDIASEGYVPTSARHFTFAMSLVPPPFDDWSFLDIGSGKGRVILLGMGYPFRRVMGVELSPGLHAIAQANLRRYRGPRRCRSVELICGDATAVPLPPGDVVIYFYNSFHGELLARFLDHLEACLRETPRRLLLIYSNPVTRAAIDARPAFTILFEGASPYDLIWRGNRRLVVYGAGFDNSTGPGGPEAASTEPTQR